MVIASLIMSKGFVIAEGVGKGATKMRTKLALATLAQISRKLLAQADEVCAVDPEMCEAAAMVYIGDTYSLRDDMIVADDQRKKASGFSTCLED